MVGSLGPPWSPHGVPMGGKRSGSPEVSHGSQGPILICISAYLLSLSIYLSVCLSVCLSLFADLQQTIYICIDVLWANLKGPALQKTVKRASPVTDCVLNSKNYHNPPHISKKHTTSPPLSFNFTRSSMNLL